MMKLYRLARFLYLKRIPLLPRFFGRLIRLLYSCEIPYTADIHPTVTFAHHGLGVVIGHRVVIGPNCKILQNVTIGGKSKIPANPVLAENVSVGAGAVILGDVHVGANVSIGANAVVLHDVPENMIAVGVPAVNKERRSQDEK